MSTQLISYLIFKGQTAEAIKFYQSIFGGKVESQTFAEVPDTEVEESQKDRIMHAQLTSDDLTLMASDVMKDDDIVEGTNVTLALVGTEAEKLRGYFNKLAEGGKVTDPLSVKFWGDEFGMVTDKFGIQWMVNIGKE